MRLKVEVPVTVIPVKPGALVVADADTGGALVDPPPQLTSPPPPCMACCAFVPPPPATEMVSGSQGS